jgi:Animal haem peroxidase
MRRQVCWLLFGATLLLGACVSTQKDLEACLTLLDRRFRPVAEERAERFQGKVQEFTARCRGGDKAVAFRSRPWVDWENYWATGDASSRAPGSSSQGRHLDPNGRGIDGTLLDLEYQRIELIKFNLFDNSGTYKEYVLGRDGVPGPALKVWDEMRLPKGHPQYEAAGGDGPQLCQGELIRFRNLTGICNDIKNPLMGSINQPFARNVQFEATFPELGKDELARNRHSDRLGLLKPDPQVISRKLFTRAQSQRDKCQEGNGLPGNSADANCDYKKAPFFNVLAAFWIQFMTHDWFSHLEEGHNQPEMMAVGCVTQLVGNVEKSLTPEEIAKLGCRPGDRMDKAYISTDGDPPTVPHKGKEKLARAYKTTRNTVTAWWDASQLYGYDDTSRRRVKRDPSDPAKLLLVPVGHRAGAGERLGYLPVFEPSDPINPQWSGQEATAFPDNWTVGTSFYHNVFAREHNLFVDAFRKQAAATPDADSGLRNPARPDEVLRYRDVGADELFEAARLVVSAEIAKIHTIEWTTQLLYGEPLYLGMNANWEGLFRGHELVEAALERITVNNFGKSTDAKKATQWYSVFASGPGIFGLGSRVYSDDTIFAKYSPRKTDIWSLKNPDHVNGGINHFGSPFNFPEEFTTVYRLHPLVPDLIEYREWGKDPNVIQSKIPVVETFRGRATQAMRERGLANWALSMGRQRLGLLTLQNHPLFLQNLSLPRLPTDTGKIDVVALDLIRDRERGVPRFNEFRRQYGLRQLTSFDDFVDQRLPTGSPERAEQVRLVGILREVYGQHRCDASKIITAAQVNTDGTPITDCLGHPPGSLVDNIEDVDTVVGWLSEFSRPHGFAISETQFQVFILNASRRLYSDRFFTSSFRPEFYTHLGVQWVTDNGPDGKVMEKGRPNGHVEEVSPLKRVLLRTIPELAPELEHAVNVFDPWARDRGEYYSLQWRARAGAESDEAFKGSK